MTTYKRLYFTNKEEKVLIGHIRDHPAIWDRSSTDYGNAALRKNSWLFISKQLQKPVEDCSRKWRFIRDYYIKKKERSSGSVVKTDSKYAKLRFLDKVMDRRKKLKKTMDTTMSEQSVNENSSDNVSEEHLEIVSDTQSETDTTIKDEESKYTDATPENCVDEEITEEFELIVTDKMPTKRQKKSLQNKGRNENATSSTIADVSYKTDLYKVDKNGKEKSIDLFFESIAETVKTFPPQLVAQAKIKVFHAINELEMQILNK